MDPLSDFAVKTCAELLRLAAEASALDPARGYDSAKRWDRLHDEINDFIDQLRGIDPEPVPLTPVQNALLASYAAEPLEDRTRNPICRCGRSKVLLRSGVFACPPCDQPPLPALGLDR